MKASLQLKIGQQLSMTPQLQQAIKLLQLSTLELQQEIQQAIEENPLLELTEEVFDTNTDTENIKDETSPSEPLSKQDQSTIETSEALTNESIPDELSMDTSWEDVFSGNSTPVNPTNFDSDYSFQGETTYGLQEHLKWQQNLTPFSDTDNAIATAIIDAIDEQGYLTQTTTDILAAMGDITIELNEVETVLKRIQHFDPIGVAARDLQDCLLIQLAQFTHDNTIIEHAKLLITNFLDLIAIRDFRTLMRKTKFKEDELREAIQLIQSLNPRPGQLIQPNEQEYVIPDVTVWKKNGRWTVELNPDHMPKVGINQHYAAMAHGSQNQTDTQFIKGHLQEAKWFIKSLASRNETLLKVTNCIVQFQHGFFEHGEEAMKPMVLNDVAQAVEMHESTISRITTQKYMHTPKGIFELKYFFSSHVSTDSGGECSSTAIRALIKKLISSENPQKPLSDSKIAQVLAEQGINVARRTIAKYREAMLIPPSNQRKHL